MREKIGEKWKEIINQEEGGLEYVLGFNEEERSCVNETKEMLRNNCGIEERRKVDKQWGT